MDKLLKRTANKRIFHIMAAVLLFFCLIPHPAAADSPLQSIKNAELSQLQLDDVRSYWENLVNQYGGFLPESQKGSFLDFLQGKKHFSIKAWLLAFLQFLFHELWVDGKLLGTIILLTVFTMILQNLQNAFERTTVSKVAYAITYMVIIILALNSFHVAISYTEEAINNMIHFLVALIPLLLALMASVGGITSVAFFHPLIVFLINTSGVLVKFFVLPMLFMSALLSIVSTLTDHYKVTQLANLLRNIGLGALAVFFAVFLGVMSVEGASAAVTDGITIRTAKFITGNFIPVIGRMFTDATDTVMSASALLRNTVGIVGVVILLCISAFPAIKIFAIALIYNIASAILQPLGGGPVIDCLNIIGKSVIFIFAALATVSLMFFLAITIIIASGNLSLMVR
ncbi:MAG TPA: stage III sporulation protein AE [Bacillales bacterium]|nr:stage III sporulation protein AE [Bacillales bacterium]